MSFWNKVSVKTFQFLSVLDYSLGQNLSIPQLSSAFGIDSRSKLFNCVAFGIESRSKPFNSIAFGTESQSKLSNSTAFGLESLLKPFNSFAFGVESRSKPFNSLAFAIESLNRAFTNLFDVGRGGGHPVIVGNEKVHPARIELATFSVLG